LINSLYKSIISIGYPLDTLYYYQVHFKVGVLIIEPNWVFPDGTMLVYKRIETTMPFMLLIENTDNVVMSSSLFYKLQDRKIIIAKYKNRSSGAYAGIVLIPALPVGVAVPVSRH
jgi:hypothetical protein